MLVEKCREYGILVRIIHNLELGPKFGKWRFWFQMVDNIVFISKSSNMSIWSQICRKWGFWDNIVENIDFVSKLSRTSVIVHIVKNFDFASMGSNPSINTVCPSFSFYIITIMIEKSTIMFLMDTRLLPWNLADN